MKTTKIPSEHYEQSWFVNWFRKSYPGVLIFAIPNGANLAGNSTARCKQWNNLKAEGAVKGIPDLFIPEFRLFIEFKRVKGGTVSPEQKQMIAHLISIGYRAEICMGAESAVNLCRSVKSPAKQVALFDKASV